MGLLLALAAVASVAAGANAQCTSLADAATEAGLTALVDTVGSVADLPEAEPLIGVVTATEPLEGTRYTIFAPTNDAFAGISDALGGASQEMVLAVLANHVVPQELFAATILLAIEETSPAIVPTLLGPTLSAFLMEDELVITPTDTDINAIVITADVETCAGVVHVIDKVLVPLEPEEGENPEGGTPDEETPEEETPMEETPEEMPMEEMPAGEYGEVDAGAYGR